MEFAGLLQVIIAGLVIGGIYALVALGLNLIYGTMRLINVAHGELIILGAYIAFWSFTLYGISPIFSILTAGMICAILGFFVFGLVFRSLLQRTRLPGGVESASLLIFFALSIIIQNAASILWKADIRGYSYLTQVVSLGGIPVTMNRLVALVGGITMCAGCYVMLHKTLWGKAVRAIIQDRDACQLIGINVDRIYMTSFALAFAAAGAAGVLLSMFYPFSPFHGLSYTIIAFVVVILGGLGNVAAGLIAGFVLGLVQTVGTSLTSPGFHSILSYLLFILVVLLKPRGIFGKWGQ